MTEVMLGLKDIPEVKWVFVGGGSRKEWLENFIKENGMEDKAVCLGQFPFKAMPAFMKEADAMLVTLRAGFAHLEAVVPARLQSYMSAGRPVLAMIGYGSRHHRRISLWICSTCRQFRSFDKSYP